MAIRFDRIVQQEPIAAQHHLDAVGDEATGLVLARMDFPIFFRAIESEQCFRDGAIALVVCPCVQGA